MNEDKKSSVFELPIRVYIEDTDIGGVVFYANYLKYFERARTEYLRSLGFELRSDFESGISYVVHSINVRYHAPAKLDQLLKVTALATKMGRTFIEFEQKVHSASYDVLVEARVKVVCVSISNLSRPRALPVALAEAIKQF